VGAATYSVENFRPGVLEKLGFGYDAVSRRKSTHHLRLDSGYGQPVYRNRPGYETWSPRRSGIVDLRASPNRQPVKVGASIADIVAGLYPARGFLLACSPAHRTGKGQHVDVICSTA